LGRSSYWRGDVEWFGAAGQPDLSSSSQSLAYLLRCASAGDQDIYVAINAWWQPLDFTIQSGGPGDWRRAIDTSLPSPDDIGDPAPLTGLTYTVAPRSVVVFVGTAA
jgi:glycogen operon protein